MKFSYNIIQCHLPGNVTMDRRLAPAGLQGSFRNTWPTTCSQLMRAALGNGNFDTSIYWAHTHGSGFPVGGIKSLLENWNACCQAEISWVAKTTSGFDVFVRGVQAGEQDTLSISRIPWGLKLSTLVRERAFFRWENWGHTHWINDRPGTLSLNPDSSCHTQGFLKISLSGNHAEKANKWTNKTLNLFTGCVIDGDRKSRALRSGTGYLAKSLSFLVCFLMCTRRSMISKVSFSSKSMPLWPQFPVFQVGIIFYFPKCLRIIWAPKTP